MWPFLAQNKFFAKKKGPIMISQYVQGGDEYMIPSTNQMGGKS